MIRVEVKEPILGSGVLQAWLVLAGLGLVLLAGALILADRLGRSFVRPIARLAAHAEHLGDTPNSEPVALDGPPEIRELGAALNRLVARIEVLLERERRGVSDLSHRLRTPITALRLRIEGPDVPDMARLSRDLDELEQMVDHVVREARRSEREGLVPEADALSVLAERTRFWSPLAEDQSRPFSLEAPPATDPPALVRSSETDLLALLDVLMDNVFTHTPEGAAVKVSLAALATGGAVLIVEDGGPGFPEGMQVADRGTSGGGSTGLGLSIVSTTAEESGGGLHVGRSTELGGARVEVRLGPPA